MLELLGTVQTTQNNSFKYEYFCNVFKWQEINLIHILCDCRIIE